MENTLLDLLNRYMRSWVDRDIAQFLDTLSPDIHLVECYGPCYEGVAECERWFTAWNKQGRVPQWKLLDHYYDPDRETLVGTWEFHVEHPDEAEPCFDGITVLRAADGKISELYEYAMKHDHYRPYQA